jgi:hypothetical protein
LNTETDAYLISLSDGQQVSEGEEEQNEAATAVHTARTQEEFRFEVDLVASNTKNQFKMIDVHQYVYSTEELQQMEKRELNY